MLTSSFHVNLKGKYLYIIFQLLVTRIKIKILPLFIQCNYVHYQAMFI